MNRTTRRLSCGCVRHYSHTPPKLGDTVWCHHHDRAALVESPAYAVRCACGRYNRFYGAGDRLTAFTKASAHALKNGHVVDVLEGSTVVHTVKPQPRLTYPDGAEAPF